MPQVFAISYNLKKKATNQRTASTFSSPLYTTIYLVDNQCLRQCHGKEQLAAQISSSFSSLQGS